MPYETRMTHSDIRRPSAENEGLESVWIITDLLIVGVVLWAIIVLVRATVDFIRSKTVSLDSHKLPSQKIEKK